MNIEDIEYLTKRLHSPAMQCRQCDVTRALIREHALLAFRASERVGTKTGRFTRYRDMYRGDREDMSRDGLLLRIIPGEQETHKHTNTHRQ